MHYFFKNLSTLEERADKLNIFLQKGTQGHTVVFRNIYQTYMGHLNVVLLSYRDAIICKGMQCLGLCSVLDSSVLAQRGHYGAVTRGLGFWGLIRRTTCLSRLVQVVNIEDLSTSKDSNLDPHGIVCIIWYFDDWIKHSHRSCSVSGSWARGDIKTRILQKIDQLIHCIGFYAVSAIFFSHITAAEGFEMLTILLSILGFNFCQMLLYLAM